MKIILDTDIGSDIDDSFALTYLLNKEDVDLECVVTCSGESYKRVSLVEEYIKLSHQKIKVLCGQDKPLYGHELQSTCQQAKVLSTFNDDYNVDETYQEVIKIVNEHPNEVTLIAIGPLTNLAILFTIDKTITSKLKQVIMMGSRLDQSQEKDYLVDWNIMCDPLAAKIVFESDVKKLVIFPCDTTYKLHHSKEYLRQNVKGKYEKLIKAMADVWFERFDGFSYHDPLCAVYAMDESIFKYKRGQMKLDFFKKVDHSYTEFIENEKGNHLVVTDFDEDKFIDELYKTINKT